VYPEQEFRKKRVIAMASESGIFDVMMMDQALSQYAEAGWLEPLTPYSK
jgi:multiple sugar transport system substrate-binding protein